MANLIACNLDLTDNILNHPLHLLKGLQIMENSTPIKTKPNITFSYESINDALYKHHPELSGEWTSLGWNEEFAVATYYLEDGSDHEVIIRRDGSVSAPAPVIKEMDEIRYYS